VEEGSNPGLYPVEVLLVLIDVCQRLNFRSFEPVLHLSRWAEAVVELSNPGLFALEGVLLVIVALAVDFQDY